MFFNLSILNGFENHKNVTLDHYSHFTYFSKPSKMQHLVICAILGGFQKHVKWKG